MKYLLLMFVITYQSLVYADADTVTSALQMYRNLLEYKKVAEMITPLAVQGNAQAQTILGLAFEHQGDRFQSEYWYRQAANQDFSHAQILLADNLKGKRLGSYVRLVYDQEAEYWLKKAASHNCDMAKNDLIFYYLDNDHYNLVKAYVWYFLLTSKDYTTIGELTLKDIPVSEAQKMQARQLAAEWKVKNATNNNQCRLLPEAP